MEPVVPDKPATPTPTGQEPPRRPAGRSAPWWLWLLALGGFAAIFWLFLPEAAEPVAYSPWFLDRVEAGAIEALSIQGLEVRGVLRADPSAQGTRTTARPGLRRFLTHFPSEHSIEPVVRRLRERGGVG